MNLAEKLKAKNRLHKTTIRGERVCLRVLTRNEMREHIEAMTAAGDDEIAIFERFASYIVDEDGNQAITLEELEDVLTNKEVTKLMEEFNTVNGLRSEDGESEKN